MHCVLHYFLLPAGSLQTICGQFRPSEPINGVQGGGRHVEGKYYPEFEACLVCNVCRIGRLKVSAPGIVPTWTSAKFSVHSERYWRGEYSPSLPLLTL
ncbi:hypothetical protein TNIN_136581 [Trichonephila inaurata madagascariensis]|uniref:Uncharacterized protein n=1 Tax=Trichonephila inaurata madagascariensis TaxID=2747483 RepID=A0A8X7CK20_9ARAC|nr:hypothetical protein TNIN_267611 [Trichonephila inaurata madagascariensis]GFY70221.1 hypothetical protein TNIN_136581 [Trichonephila inaurata madagascariensis]